MSLNYSAGSAPGKKVLIGMSGGIGSFVAASLLKREGYRVTGLHLRMTDAPDARCGKSSQPARAKKACELADVELIQMDARAAFEDRVSDYFLHEFIQNRACNPCISCNQEIRLRTLLQKAAEGGFDFIATGHFARVVRQATLDSVALQRAMDAQRDQSDLLFGLTQMEVSKLLLPIGGLSGEMIERLAREFGYPVESAVSEAPCFAGSAEFRDLIEKRVPPSLRPGGIVRTTEGRVVGEHSGLFGFQIGEKTGDLAVSDSSPDSAPLFVSGFDSSSHSLVVSNEGQLFYREVIASAANWIRPMDRLRGRQCQVRIRGVAVGTREASGWVSCFENDTLSVGFDEPQRALIPGQALVFYDGEELLGGAYVERGISSPEEK